MKHQLCMAGPIGLQFTYSDHCFCLLYETSALWLALYGSAPVLHVYILRCAAIITGPYTGLQYYMCIYCAVQQTSQGRIQGSSTTCVYTALCSKHHKAVYNITCTLRVDAVKEPCTMLWYSQYTSKLSFIFNLRCSRCA